MTQQQPTFCPRCNSSLTPSVRGGFAFEACRGCGLRFVDGGQIHSACGHPMAEHMWRCPTSKTDQRVLCPLCGAYRHRKDAAMSRRVYSWRQWALATGLLAQDSAPDQELPDQTDPRLVAEYNKWIRQHPDLEAGSVPAERIFRQRMREHGTLLTTE